VRDYGIGIAPDALPRIFDRSYRGPEAAAHATGLGLGLTIAAEIVTRHGGTIAATPADGRGTVFTVRLPRHAGATPSAPGEEQTGPSYAAASGEDRRPA
ncbi:MAG TPA: sensor histidine kinase, partial [Vicinamibacterales bacterium]|nr:sensor histidine kinase [Vicinamibacterales bacterium]